MPEWVIYSYREIVSPRCLLGGRGTPSFGRAVVFVHTKSSKLVASS